MESNLSSTPRNRISNEKGQAYFGAVIASVIGVFLFVLLIFVLVAGTYTSIPPDKIALHYSGGPIDGTHYIETVQPGTKAKFYGLSENIYKLPSTQRTYIVSKSVDEGDKTGIDFISAPSKDRVSFTFEAAVYFKLNMDPETLRKFFEEICLHDSCYTSDGWKAMLNQYFRKPLEQAIAQEAKKYSQSELYSDPDVLNDLNASVSKGLADDINRSLGGNYFCGPDSTPSKCGDFRVIIKNPTPSQSVVDAYNAAAAAKQQVVTATEKANAAIQTAEGEASSAIKRAEGARTAQDIRAQAAALSQAQLDYIKAQALATCAGNTNCTLIISQDGTGVNVNTGR
jgi:regulator of protease activity HflC (stomatin/prohibitin superfamily)